MRLLLTGRHVDITPQLRQLVDRKLGKLGRVLNDSIVSSQVVLTREKYRCVAEVTVHARGDHMLHGLGEAPAWPASLTQAVEKISQQAHKVKEKWEQRKRRATAAKALPPPEVAPREPGGRPSPRAGRRELAEGRAQRIVRASGYAVKPMTVEDAALRVNAGGDEFVVFRNAATDAINILYRRKDGQLGLIEPEA